MRFRLLLEFLGEPPFVMPVNYQYELSESINKLINFNNKKVLQKLEKSGFLNDDSQFKFFNFSNLDIENFEQDNDRLITDNQHVEMFVSILADKGFEQDFFNLFNGKELRFGDKNNKVTLLIKDIELQPEPNFTDSMDFRLISPAVICDNDDNNVTGDNNYISPDDENYEKLFFKNLLTKYALLIKSVKSDFVKPINSNFSQLKFNCTSKPASRIVPIKKENQKQILAKGYFFEFNIKAPAELIKLGYNAGFGEFTDLGFGCSIIIR